MSVPFIVRILHRLCPQARWKQEMAFRLSILLLTYLAYMSYHLSRKPISIVKNAKAFLDCDHADDVEATQGISNATCRSWITEIDGKTEQEAKTYLGFLDTSYLFSYAFFMFLSGFVAERVDLRFFLALGMLMSGLMTVLFGMAYSLGIHSIWYLLVIQILCGMFQTTGWPGVVTVMANWFGKGKRGVIMGIWNSHTSLGNILGSLVAGAFVTTNWGLSFTVPGLIIGVIGFCLFLFLVPAPEDVGFTTPPTVRSHGPLGEDDPLIDEENCEDKEEEDEEDDENGYDGEQEAGYTPQVEEVKSSGAIGFIGALRIPGVVEFSLCLFFAKLVSYTFLYWLPNYIHTRSHVNAEESAFLSTVFDWGGIIGGIIAGVITDRTGMSATVCSVMLVVAIPTMYLYENLVSDICPISQIQGVPVHNACFTWNIVVLGLTGVLVNGPYALITTAVSAELGQHPSLQGSQKALATVTAIIDGTGSIGAAIGPLLAGPLSADNHWKRVFYMLMASDVIALLLLTRLMRNELIRFRIQRGRARTGQPVYRSIENS